MTVEDWLRAATDDAERRELEGLKPILQALARSTKALRAAESTIAPAIRRPEEIDANR